MSDIYNLSPKHCATQQERRVSLVKQQTTTKNRQSAKKIRKIVSYSSSEDDNDENESPMIIRRQKPTRFRLDDSIDEEMVELERRQRYERQCLKKKIEKSW